jgi:hypothetical protein
VERSDIQKGVWYEGDRCLLGRILYLADRPPNGPELLYYRVHEILRLVPSISYFKANIVLLFSEDVLDPDLPINPYLIISVEPNILYGKVVLTAMTAL